MKVYKISEKLTSVHTVLFDTNSLAKFVEKIWNIQNKHCFNLSMFIFGYLWSLFFLVV